MPIENIEALKQELANTSAGGSTFEFPQVNNLKLQYGTQMAPAFTKLKLFSWPPTGGTLAKHVKIHFGLAASGKAQVNCPKTDDESAHCVLCDIVTKATQEGDNLQRQAALKFISKDRYLILCLNMTEIEAGAAPKVYVWNISPGTYTSIITEMQQEWGDFTLLQNGHLLRVSTYKVAGSQAGRITVAGSKETQDVLLENLQFPDLKSITASPPPAMMLAMLGKAPQAPISFIPAKGTVHAQQHTQTPQPIAPVVTPQAAMAAQLQQNTGTYVQPSVQTTTPPPVQTIATPAAQTPVEPPAPQPAMSVGKPKRSLDDILNKPKK